MIPSSSNSCSTPMLAPPERPKNSSSVSRSRAIKKVWSKEEDELIYELVNEIGPKNWTEIAKHLPNRQGKQCRERWFNHLDPSINKTIWGWDE